MIKKIFYPVLYIIPVLICLFSFSIKANCANVYALNTFLKAATLIGSEYLVARNGQTLNNSASENINDGELGSITVKPDYSSVIVDALGGQGPNLNDLNSIATDFDVSHMSQQELAKFNALLIGDDHLSGENILYKTCTVNGVTAYWAVNQAGQWIGDSIENIAVKFIPNTQTLSYNIDNVLTSNYDFKNLLYTKSCNFQVTDTSIYINAPITYAVNLTNKVYFYTENHLLYAVIPETYSDSLGHVNIVSNNGYVYSTDCHIEYDNDTKFVINNTTYIYGWVNTGSPYYGIHSNSNISSLNTIKGQIQARGYLGDVVYADIIDLNSDLGYKVQDTLDNVVPISDIYFAIQQLEDAINGLRTNQQGLTDGLTIGLDSNLMASIQQAITDAISNGLAITDNQQGGGSTENDDTNQGISIPPNFNNNIVTNVSNILGLPLQFVSMFSPIFKIFGSNIPLFGLWLFFPIVLIIGVVVWVLK